MCDTRGSEQRARYGKLVGLSGLEPPTSRLSGVRSNRLSYRPMLSGLIALSLGLGFRVYLLSLFPYSFVNVLDCTLKDK